MTSILGDEAHVIPLLPSQEVVKTQYKLMAKIITQAAGLVKGNSSVRGYEQWVPVVNYNMHVARNLDAQDKLIGVPDAQLFRFTCLWDSGPIVALTQSIFTAEEVISCELHCLRAGTQGEIEPVVEIILEKGRVLDVVYVYSHPAGPLIIIDIHPTKLKIIDKTSKTEFAWDLTQLTRVM
ncbi:TPA: hypothetical protein I8034_003057 [Legionella pneumophila]|nr:hypothetical protein [Legionella pneumophila]HAT2137537.1 hypothetical protein [Legionella pneumophila]HAT2143649.1 hypothetical protein [Legionella pneumophila]HAT2146800.1 hypothetical protein [Legionella pneumophila]HAT2161917.1 hypothetical protein [Legionella pneumophila]